MLGWRCWRPCTTAPMPNRDLSFTLCLRLPKREFKPGFGNCASTKNRYFQIRTRMRPRLTATDRKVFDPLLGWQSHSLNIPREVVDGASGRRSRKTGGEDG